MNTISPGIISTPQGRAGLAGHAGGYFRAIVEKSSLRRLGSPGEFAAAAAFLLGPDAGFITGTDLLVDGGALPRAALMSCFGTRGI